MSGAVVPPITIGSKAGDCDLQVGNDYVSVHHATIVVAASLYKESYYG